jgi:hypothetical protein
MSERYEDELQTLFDAASLELTDETFRARVMARVRRGTISDSPVTALQALAALAMIAAALPPGSNGKHRLRRGVDSR